MQQTAIIGAGMAGLTLAGRLGREAGHQVTVFDKSRGLGGRMAVRRSATHSFDHGARFFIARDPGFQAYLAPYLAAGDLVEWAPRVVTLKPGKSPYGRLWYEPHYIGAPQMNSLCKAMAAGLTTVTGAELTAIEGTAGAWHLGFKGGSLRGPFTRVLLAVPAPQAATLIPDAALVDRLAAVRFEPGFSLMVSLSAEDPLVHGHKALAATFDAAQVEASSLQWLCFDHARPGRTGLPALLAQTTAAWAQTNLDAPLEEVKDRLLGDLNALLGSRIADGQLHRWRYAQAEEPLGQAFMLSEQAEATLGVCGDWCLGRGVEAAYLSATALADAIVQTG